MSYRKHHGAIVAACPLQLIRLHATALFVLLVAACDLRANRESPVHTVSLNAAVADAGCGVDSVRPSTGAPAEGLWAYADPATSHRVAARIGPSGSAAGATRVTRTVETLETRPGADTIRHASDTASVKLEFIPPFDRAAAVYSIGPLVQLAAYEPCRGHQEPLIRYLRKDAAGRLTTDVLLHREARP
jgi:hypothetical protein